MKNARYLALWLLLILKVADADAAYLMADLSTNEVFLNYNFKGQQITISGISKGIDDILITVEGPSRPYRAWQKESINDMWLSSTSFNITNAPSYFFIASSAKRLQDITAPDTLEKLGVRYPSEHYTISEHYTEARLENFKKNFQLYKQSIKLYPTKIEAVEMVAPNMFRTKFFVPEHATTGEYKVKIYAFTDHKLQKQLILYFKAVKVGLYASIDEISRTMPMLYALSAIAIALIISAIAGLIFRKHA